VGVETVNESGISEPANAAALWVASHQGVSQGGSLAWLKWHGRLPSWLVEHHKLRILHDDRQRERWFRDNSGRFKDYADFLPSREPTRFLGKTARHLHSSFDQQAFDTAAPKLGDAFSQKLIEAFSRVLDSDHKSLTPLDASLLSMAHHRPCTPSSQVVGP